MKHLLTVIFCMIVYITQINARLTFQTFDVKSGISDNYVIAMLRDQYGFMWFATLNGLNRYDGYQCKQYWVTDSDTYSNCFNNISEDASGTIWVRTPDQYFYYNRELDKLESNIEKRLRPLGINDKIEMIHVDYEQNLWCMAGNKLYYYDFQDKKLQELSFPDKELLHIVSRQSYSCLLFSNGEIAEVDWETKTVRKIVQLELPRSGEHRIYMDTRLRLWIYTIYTSNLQCYDIQNRKMFEFSGKETIQSDIVKAIIDDGNGNIWIGTNSKGIYILNEQTDNLMHIHRDSGTPFSLSSNHINSFYKDNQDILWVGTTKQGVAFTDLNNTAFEICKTPEQEDISCFQEDRNGNLWLGFDGKGLACYDSKQINYKLFNTHNSNIPSNLIIGSYLDSKGKMWFGSYGGGIFYEQNGTFFPFEQTLEPIEYVRHIADDKYGNLWVGTFMHGLYCIDNGGKITSYTKENSCLYTNTITDLVYSSDHAMLYIGTSTGLYELNTQTQQLAPVKGNDNEVSLIKMHISCLYRDQRGLLWIGTRHGIRIYDEKSRTLTRLSTNDGVSHPYIRGIVEDHNKNMWIATDCGITHIIVVDDPTAQELQYRCYSYFNEDGIGDITFNNYSIYCNRKGEILMGGTGKYLKIDPNQALYHPKQHKVIFTGLYLANQRVDVEKKMHDGRILLQKNIQLLDEITMDYSDSNFALEISAMDYGTQHKLQFAYRMDAKEEWVSFEGNRIHFNKLSPGIYNLQVKVNELHGSRNPISYMTILVRPPFWLSPVAYVIYMVLFLSGGVVLLRRLRSRHQRILVQQKWELEVAQQHEMDEAKIRFFTNISHDLRTPLSLIITPLEKLIHSEKAGPIKDDLDLMYRNASTLLDEVNQLLDFRKLDQQKVQLSLSYGDITEFIAETCKSFKALSQKHNIELKVCINTSKIEMDFDRNKVQRIISNLLSNAIKYNHDNGSVIVAIDKILAGDGEQIHIQISDTGIGIKNENKDKIFDRFFQEQHISTTYIGSGIGLHIVKEYVTLHGGEIKVEDNHPQGTIFTVILPIAKTLKLNCTEDTSAFDVEEQFHADMSSVDREKNSLLIVEDNDDFRSFLVGCLQEYYQVYEASDGKKALTVLAQQSIHVVISDIMMPVMDGMELCRKIKTDIRYSHIPIILLTARTAEEHILSGLKEGADEYITKPFNLEILLLRIRKLLMWTLKNHDKFKTRDISPSEITISSLDEQLIEKAIRIVEENMDNSEFSVEELSAQIGMSRSGLYKKLMQITGKSPLEFMRILRLKRGRKLLEGSQMNISQISYQVGLSPKQFAKFFKEEFGYLPSEYKKKEEK